MYHNTSTFAQHTAATRIDTRGVAGHCQGGATRMKSAKFQNIDTIMDASLDRWEQKIVKQRETPKATGWCNGSYVKPKGRVRSVIGHLARFLNGDDDGNPIS